MVPTDWFPKARLVEERLATVAVPVPERLTVWGLPVALSVMARAAARLPLAEGVKVTLMVQLAPAATRTAAIIGLGKVAGIGAGERDAGDAQGRVAGVGQGDSLSRAGGADGLIAKGQAGGGNTGDWGVVPVPERLTVWGLPAALSVTMTAAVRVPCAAGLKVTLMVQLAPAATLDPQLLVWAKSLALVPETAMLVTLKSALPELVRVIDLRRGGGADGLVGESEAGGGKAGRGRTACSGEVHTTPAPTGGGQYGHCNAGRGENHSSPAVEFKRTPFHETCSFAPT